MGAKTGEEQGATREEEDQCLGTAAAPGTKIQQQVILSDLRKRVFQRDLKTITSLKQGGLKRSHKTSGKTYSRTTVGDLHLKKSDGHAYLLTAANY